MHFMDIVTQLMIFNRLLIQLYDDQNTIVKDSEGEYDNILSQLIINQQRLK